MTLFTYQENAVEALFKKIKKAIGYYMVDIDGGGTFNTRTIHFTSPTGSGKTIMAFVLMDELIKEYENLVFVWIAPNTLHTQSLDKFDTLVDAIASNLNPIDSDGIESDNVLGANDILCLNWSSLDKKNNTLIKENESGKYIDNIMHLTREDDKIIIALIDESHIASSNDTTFVQNGYESISVSQKKQPTLFDTETNLTPFETINLLKILKTKLEEKANQEFSYLEIFQIILQHGNYENFVSMLSDIKNMSSKKRLAGLQKETLFEKMNDSIRWSPEKSFICDSKLLLRLTKKSIYTKDCIKDFNKTEKRFVALLETMQNVAYWYRNGSRGNYFRVPYKKENIVREFYPDFIVVYNDGKIGIYDTKSEMTASDGEAKDKAEYLYTYCDKFGFKNGLIKIEEKGDVNYFRINQRENYKNYDNNKVEWEDFGTLIEEKNIFKDLDG